ncbi:unnamed protein product [Linum trigynum]
MVSPVVVSLVAAAAAAMGPLFAQYVEVAMFQLLLLLRDSSGGDPPPKGSCYGRSKGDSELEHMMVEGHRCSDHESL